MLCCPNCKSEHRTHVAECSDCGAVLVGKLGECASIDDCSEGDTPTFLRSIEDNIEAEMTIALLQCNNIPVLRKRHGAGEYLKIYMGMSYYGMDIYVPSKLHAKASEILAAEPILEQEYVMEDDTLRAIQKHNRTNRIKVWVFIAIFTGPGLWLLGSYLFFMLQSR